MDSPRILNRIGDHAAALNIARSTFYRALPDLMARGYPARWIGRQLVGEYDAIMDWLSVGDSRATPDAQPHPKPQAQPESQSESSPQRRGRGRPRKAPLPVRSERARP